MDLGFVSRNTPEDISPGVLGTELEQRGFESMWVGEHPQVPVSAKDRFAGGLPSSLKEMFDPFLALLPAALATQKLRIGTGVALPLEHNVFDFAKQVATLDRMSGGRLLLGVGVGFRDELEVGSSFAWKDRYRALGDMVAALDTLWNDEESEHHGAFFDFDPVWCYPKPHQRPRPPLLAATSGPTATRHCATWADGWIPSDGALTDVASAVAGFRRAVEDAGRDPAQLDLTIMAWGRPDLSLLASYRDLGFGRVLVGAGRRGDAGDWSATRAFLDDYAAMIDELR